MTKERKIIVIITIISILTIAILSYFLINKNAIIEKQAEKIELQAMETNGSNSYVTTQEHLKETSQNISKVAYGNTGTIAKREIRTIPLDFTPDFVCVASKPTYDIYRRVYTFCGIKCNDNSEKFTEIEYVPSMHWFVINDDTYSNNYEGCNYITIAENEIQIHDDGWGATNVFWIAIKCKN